MSQYSIAIVDDELLARELLQDFILKFPELELKGVFSNAPEAIDFMANNTLDILLTDIQMPHLSGIEFIKSCNRPNTIIFTTAYSNYALEGFDLNITDYLLKPISFQRFDQAIQRAKEYINLIRSQPISGEKMHMENKEFLTVRADYKLYKINYDSIIYIEGQSEYVKFYTTQKNITAYYALKKLEIELPAHQFIRIHKSYIVSKDFIEAIESDSVVIPGAKLPIGSSYKEQLLKAFL
jgi:DNA-binding LytR/AlgR family response regulator